MKEKAAQHKVRAAGYRARPNPAQLSEIGQLIDDGRVQVAVARTFALADAHLCPALIDESQWRAVWRSSHGGGFTLYKLAGANG